MKPDAQPPAKVDDHISHLADLTAQRDREMLDISLAQGVLELLPASSVGVYRLVGADDEPQRWALPGGWLFAFEQDLRALLLAELQVRLEPLAGLLEAAQSHDSRPRTTHSPPTTTKTPEPVTGMIE